VLFYASNDQYHFLNTELPTIVHSHLWNGLKKYSKGKKEIYIYIFHIHTHTKKLLSLNNSLYTYCTFPLHFYQLFMLHLLNLLHLPAVINSIYLMNNENNYTYYAQAKLSRNQAQFPILLASVQLV
jgi:hypothetical protein